MARTLIAQMGHRHEVQFYDVSLEHPASITEGNS